MSKFSPSSSKTGVKPTQTIVYIKDYKECVMKRLVLFAAIAVLAIAGCNHGYVAHLPEMPGDTKVMRAAPEETFEFTVTVYVKGEMKGVSGVLVCAHGFYDGVLLDEAVTDENGVAVLDIDVRYESIYHVGMDPRTLVGYEVFCEPSLVGLLVELPPVYEGNETSFLVKHPDWVPFYRAHCMDDDGNIIVEKMDGEPVMAED